jgi:Spy/CpxP family protein refolding chaperone
MKKLLVFAIAVAVLALTAAPALAQKPPFGGGGFGMSLLQLAGQQSVQEELKITDEQRTRIQELNQKQRETFKELFKLQGEERQKRIAEINAANEKALGEILKPEQMKRLKQISYQQRGLENALSDPEVASALNLSAEQREKIQAIRDDARQKRAELFKAGGSAEERRQRFAEFQKSITEKLTGVLTAEQQAKWKELIGPEFKGELNFGKPGKPIKPAEIE